jgi:bacteriorhodopsin
MDVSSILLAVVCVGSILIIGGLADDLGRKPSRWMWIAVAIGPFAIPMLYLVAAISAVRKMVSAPRPS